MNTTDNDTMQTETTLPTRRKRRRWVTVVLGLAILLCGFVLGAGTAVVGVKKIVSVIHTPGEAPKRIANRMQRRLDLSDEKTAEVREILTKRQTELFALIRRIEPDVEKQLKRTREDVAGVLDPEQAKEWRDWYDCVQQKWLDLKRLRSSNCFLGGEKAPPAAEAEKRAD